MNIKELQEQICKTMETKLGLVGNHALSNDNFCTINPRTKERINLQPWDVVHRLSNGEVVNYRAATQDDFKDLLTVQDSTKKPFIGHKHVGFVHSDISNDEGPECYTYEVKHEPLEDPGGWDTYNAISIDTAKDREITFKQEKSNNHKIFNHPKEWDKNLENSLSDIQKRYKVVVKEFNSLTPEEQLSDEGIKKRDKIIELHGRIKDFEASVQDFKNDDIRTFARFKKYFNSESLHHALVFGSIVFGLKMIEMNWTFILGYINSIPIEGVYLMTMVFILSQTIIRVPKSYETGPK